MKTPGLRSVVRNSGFLFGSHVARTLSRGVYIIVLARLLQPDDYGMLNYGISWSLTFLAFTTFGLDIVLGRDVGRREAGLPALVGSTFLIRVAAALVFTTCACATAFVVEPSSNSRELVIVFSLAIVGRAIWQWCVSTFIAFEKTLGVLSVELVFRPLEIVLILLILLVFTQQNLTAVAFAHAALWWMQSAVGVYLILSRVTPLDLRINRSYMRRLLVAGIPGALYILAITCFTQVPVVLYRLTIGSGEELGNFTLSIQVVGYLLAVPFIVATTALPVLSRSAARKDGKDAAIAVKTLIWIPVISLVFSAVGMWLAPPLTILVFGAEFAQAGVILSEAIWLLPPFILATGLQQIVFARSHDVNASLPALLGAIAMLVLFSPLAQILFYRGALLAVGVGLVTWSIGLVLILVKRRVLTRHPDQINPPPI